MTTEAQPVPVGHSGRSSRSRHRINPETWDNLVEPLLIQPADVPGWRPDVVDSGFGTGESVLALADQQPDARILAVETYDAGVLRLARRLPEPHHDHVRLAAADIRDVLPHLAPDSVREFRIFFPDPWPKRKHTPRRLINDAFLTDVIARLQPDGVLWFATDIDDYADQVVELTAARTDLQALDGPPVARPATKYESIAAAAGRVCRDFAWQRIA